MVFSLTSPSKLCGVTLAWLPFLGLQTYPMRRWYLRFCQKGKRRWGASPLFLIHFSAHWNSLPATHPICHHFFSHSLSNKSEKKIQSDSSFYSFLFNIPLNLFIIFFYISIFSASVPLLADTPLMVLWPRCLSQPPSPHPSQISAELMSRRGRRWPESTRRRVHRRAASTPPGHETRFQSLFVAMHVISGEGGGGACNVCLDDARRGLERLLLCAVKARVWHKEHT